MSLVSAFLRELREWDAWCERAARAEQAVCGGGDPIWLALERGYRGIGCRGTKGVGRPEPPEVRWDVGPEPAGGVRFWALGQEHRAICLMIVAHRAEVYAVRAGTRALEVSLEEYVGLHFGPPEQRARWQRKVAEGDATPALAGAADAGHELLEQVAETWFSVPVDRDRSVA